MQHQTIARILNLIADEDQQILNLSVDDARALLLSDDPPDVLRIEGSFALLARDGQRVRLARSLDRPLRYFLAKAADGPVLIVADRIDEIATRAGARGAGGPVPPELHAHGAGAPRHDAPARRLPRSQPGPPALLRSAARDAAAGPRRHRPAVHRGALLRELRRWLAVQDRGRADRRPLLRRHRQRRGPARASTTLLLDAGQIPARLKAFTLSVDGDGDDRAQAREFLRRTGPRDVRRDDRVPSSATRSAARRRASIEDYKPLDVECAAMNLALLAGASASAIPSGACSSTATAATRTSRTTRSRRTPS